MDKMSNRDIGIDPEPEDNNGSGSDDDDDDAFSGDERFKNHQYMFVHVGKAGGSTVHSNIYTLCLRRMLEQNIRWQSRNWRKNVGSVKCIRSIKKQAERNPSTEMALSNDRVVGYMHMNHLSYWWNANDDGTIVDPRASNQNIQETISAILAAGKGSHSNITLIRNPPNIKVKEYGMTTSTAFLLPIRDPIDRLVSAFNYHHPSNHHTQYECKSDLRPPKISSWGLQAFYCDCFNTINDLVDVFAKNSGPPKKVPGYKHSKEEEVTCREVAERLLRGKSHYKLDTDDKTNESQFREDQLVDLDIIKKTAYTVGHVTMNYGYYYRLTLQKYPQKDIVAIRTDHMWEDLQQLEYNLGGSALIQGNTTGHAEIAHGSHAYPVSDKIKDSRGLQIICCAISSEAKIYIELIERAINLSAEQKQESLNAFQERCNLELCGE
eukprot:CAMPEP_0116139552 /NCGR_PEP_ID=MMETSP0329-20121206/13373_1 /TAXON_ID=697910 /ORGANISM="Pseudo-nitzschia arenysensis, Strain B593" /LENGTH=435 /DNA_ID=CAMNT_0003634603 /DNA_START=15 /DNA_END=1322 /DNA_ORIENTATION=-